VQAHAVADADPALSLTEHVVLALVVETSRHGFAVANELKAGTAVGRVWTVHRPLVYRALDRLAALGLIERDRTEPGARGPERTLLRGTLAGREVLLRWLGTPVEHPRLVRADLMAKFVVAARLGVPLAPLAIAQREHFSPAMAGMARAADEAEGTDRIVATWRLEALRANDRMLERVIRGEFGPADAQA
jgi:DNA-binding PadR family transcriptional regulator